MRAHSPRAFSETHFNYQAPVCYIHLRKCWFVRQADSCGHSLGVNREMKIRVLSDLHLEFRDWVPPESDADVVVLAGDIHVGVRQ